MDAEALSSCESYAALVAVRDDHAAKVRQGAAEARASVFAQGENRAARRLRIKQMRMINKGERDGLAAIERIFSQLARDFDPKLGTGKAVHDDAAGGLAEIFGEKF